MVFSMLHWKNAPDEIFHTLIHDTIEDTLGELAMALAMSDEDGADSWQAMAPRSARLIPPPEAILTLKKLLECHVASVLYMPTEYHWLMLYERLEGFIGLLAEKPDDYAVYKKFGVRRIDFNAVIDTYFWDTDFLFDPELKTGTDPSIKAGIDFSDELFGIVTGMAPHPTELEPKLITDAEIPRSLKHPYRLCTAEGRPFIQVQIETIHDPTHDSMARSSGWIAA